MSRGRKRESYFTVTVLLHTCGLILRTNTLHSKYAYSLSIVQVELDIVFDKLNFAKAPYEETKEAGKARVSEGAPSALMIDFLGILKQVLST